MSYEHPPQVVLPTELSDEAAAKLLEFLYHLAAVLESQYDAQLRRYYHLGDEQQLWCDDDPPF